MVRPKKSRQIPLLPLRGLHVFPATSIHLDVGRKKSVLALDQALNKEEQHIILATQKDLSVDEPNEEGIYLVGTLAKIKNVVRLPNGTVRIQVEGLARAKVLEYAQDEKYHLVDVEVITDEDIHTNEIEALLRTLKNMFEDYLQHAKKITAETIQLIREETAPGRIADMIAANLPIKVEQKQKLLETYSITDRLQSLIDILKDEQEIIGLERKINIRVRKSMEKTQKEYYLREQMKAIQKELGNKDGRGGEVDALRKQIKEANMPEEVEEKALKELERFERMSVNTAESGVLRNYLEWLIQLPWLKETEDNLDVNHAEAVLDEDHYGLEKVKERVLEYLAVQQLTKELKGPIICLTGPPGVGKTSLARSIARSLGRNFVRISLGGVRDEAEIRGHRRTYVGAMPGRMIQGMKKAGSINPVFLLDEIDKMAHDFRGDPSSALLEVLDPEQNHTFSDHYIEEPYDLSKVMFITTANNISMIPGPLLDRMEVISIAGYTEVEKLQIAKNYLLPKQMEDHGLTKGMLQVKDEAIQKVIRYYTREAGVRNLERQLAALCRKAAKMIVSGEKKRVILTNNTVEALLGKPRFRYGLAEVEDQIGAATGLAYTAAGGDTLSIEVSIVPGKGKLTLTGKLGDVMQESAQAAFSYVRSRSKMFEIEPDFNEKYDIHIHVPEGATPKDGPSAGITIATALISALTNKPVKKEVGMTGEITLRGRVLPIGGLKEKAMSAHRAGLKKIILPRENEKDIDDIPESVRKDLTFVLVSHLDEVLSHALGEKL